MTCLKLILAAAVALAFGAAAMAADDAPEPTTTTSPGKSKSEVLIQTDTFPDTNGKLVLKKAYAEQFTKSRKALRAAVARFQKLAKSAEKGFNPKLRSDMNAALRSINSNAGKLAALAQQEHGKPPKTPKPALAKFDGVDGESSDRDIRNLVNQVRKLDARVASLEVKVSN